MITLIEELKKNPIITSCNQILISDLDMKDCSEHLKDTIEKNSERNTVVEFYYESHKKNVQGFLIVPKSSENSPKFPCIIYNRGGTKNFGEIEKINLFKGIFTPTYLALNEYCVIMSNYAGSSISEGVDEYGSMKDLDDVLILKEIIDSLTCVDTKRIGMCGFSRGGLVAYQALTKVNWLKAVVVISAPTDFFRVVKSSQVALSFFSKLFNINNEELSIRSPLLWTEKFNKNVPMLVIHGDLDERVPINDSYQIIDEIKKQNIVHKFLVLEGGDHMLNSYIKEKSEAIVDWFDLYIKDETKNSIYLQND